MSSPKKKRPKKPDKHGELVTLGDGKKLSWAKYREMLKDMPEPTIEQINAFKDGPIGDPGRKRK